jgi:hypothetical protein
MGADMNDQVLRDTFQDGALTMRAKVAAAIQQLILDTDDTQHAERIALLDAIKVIDAVVA